MRHLPLLSLALAAGGALLPAQETFWIANRASSDIMEVTPWGSVRQRIAMGTTLRSAHVAPDGKIWVVRFIQGTFDIVDPATSTITPVASTLGSPYQVAFDANGHGWVSGGTGVQHFDQNGVLIQAYPLSVAAPLGITVDTAGNKWIAHRTTPASVSRIDPTGGVTNFPLVGATTQPVSILADFRGLLNPSRIWVVGDGTAQLIEIDDQGNTLNVYPLPVASVSTLASTPNGNIWCGSFATGALMQVDQTNGSILNNYALTPSVIGLACDTFGRLWATARITFSGVGPPCQVRRIDPSNGVVEIPTALEIGGFSGIGTQSALSTQYNYCLVAAPFSDLDGDGDANYSEVVAGTAPRDPSSNSTFHADSRGVTSIGSTASIDVKTQAGTFWLLTFSFGLVPAGSGISLPGFSGELRLDPTQAVGVTLSGVGPQNLPLALPLNTALQGVEMFMQGFRANATNVAFTNIGGLKIW